MDAWGRIYSSNLLRWPFFLFLFGSLSSVFPVFVLMLCTKVSLCKCILAVRTVNELDSIVATCWKATNQTIPMFDSSGNLEECRLKAKYKKIKITISIKAKAGPSVSWGYLPGSYVLLASRGHGKECERTLHRCSLLRLSGCSEFAFGCLKVFPKTPVGAEVMSSC